MRTPLLCETNPDQHASDYHSTRVRVDVPALRTRSCHDDAGGLVSLFSRVFGVPGIDPTESR